MRALEFSQLSSYRMICKGRAIRYHNILGGAKYWTCTAVNLRTMESNCMVSIIPQPYSSFFFENITDVFTKCQFVINDYAENFEIIR